MRQKLSTLIIISLNQILITITLSKVIKQLSNKTPNQMFKVLEKLKIEICKNIDTYYESNTPETYGKEEFIVDPDNFLLIVIFSLIKSGESKLIVH